jgi:hypothetical protein
MNLAALLAIHPNTKTRKQNATGSSEHLQYMCVLGGRNLFQEFANFFA